jgi:2-phospho-L-lactate guanylyltransferase
MHPIWIIIPAQSFDKSKTRLAPVLDLPARARFSRACLAHVVRTARGLVSARRIVVVSRAAEVLGLAQRLGVHALQESGGGLNKAVTEASAFARRRGAMATLVLHADLPGIRTKDVRMLLSAITRHKGVVLAPDEAREGSNALGLRPPGAIPYRFGLDSFHRHCAEARSARRFVHIINEMGLARDIDTPENFRVFSDQGKSPG